MPSTVSTQVTNPTRWDRPKKDARRDTTFPIVQSKFHSTAGADSALRRQSTCLTHHTCKKDSLYQHETSAACFNTVEPSRYKAFRSSRTQYQPQPPDPTHDEHVLPLQSAAAKWRCTHAQKLNIQTRTEKCVKWTQHHHAAGRTIAKRNTLQRRGHKVDGCASLHHSRADAGSSAAD